MPVVYDAGVQPGSSEDSAGVFRKRLTSSLVVPDEAKQSKLDPAWRKPRVTDAAQVLDVSRLSLEQRVFVQLSGIGLISNTSSNVQVRGCNGRFAIFSSYIPGMAQRDVKILVMNFALSSSGLCRGPDDFVAPVRSWIWKTIPNRSARQ